MDLKIIIEAVKRSEDWMHIKRMAEKVPDMERRIAELERMVAGRQIARIACDHCGSERLERAGNRPHPDFGDQGVKLAVYRCEACGRESEFSIP